METFEVISAFVDNEAFEPAELGRALADPGGRELLLDLLALRGLVRDEPIEMPVQSAHSARSPQKWVAVGFLAASIVFGAGAAWLLPPLLRQPADVPPTPDHVVVFDTLRDTP